MFIQNTLQSVCVRGEKGIGRRRERGVATYIARVAGEGRIRGSSWHHNSCNSISHTISGAVNCLTVCVLVL